MVDMGDDGNVSQAVVCQYALHDSGFPILHTISNPPGRRTIVI
jgi:hypothetical protein